MFTWTKILDDVIAGKPVSEFPSYTPCADHLVFPTLKSWDEGRVYAEWPVLRDYLNSRGHVFGGYFGVLADMTFCFTVMTILKGDEGFSTSDLRISYFRPVSDGTLHIEGRVLHRSRKSIHVEALFSNEAGKPVAKATGVMSIISMKSLYGEKDR